MSVRSIFGNFMKFWVLVLALVLALAGMDAQAARRLGGGKSIGKQSSNVTQREANPGAPAQPNAPSQGIANGAPKPAPVAPAVAPRRPWGAMLGGLAAGLGLAWLAHSLGMGEGFGQILVFALLAFGAVMLVRWFLRSKSAGASASQSAPFAFQGTGNLPVSNREPYRPENVGNDASARPWERSASMPLENAGGQSGSVIGSALKGSQSWGVPAGFDSEGFLGAAKTNFVALQLAWDRSDIPALRAMMTDDMLKEIQSQLAERESQSKGIASVTEVVMVDAHLLGIEEQATEYLASVEFSGMIREDASSGPNPFREVWNMTKSKNGSTGWLVAGVQALQ
jgi:predicted lipid-binding transport protein (Tim44 family)